MSTFVHVYAPEGDAFALVIDCPTCCRQRRALGRMYEWHGAWVTCAGCGDEWNDGERMGRPFAPGWRRVNIERARAGLAALGINA